jgi:signal peptidase
MIFFKKAITFLVTLILFFVTVFFLFSQFNFPGNYKILLVQSGSMSPVINTGDLVVVKPSFKYKKGDVITFASTNRFNVTHRIVSIENNKITTKGDANQSSDQETVNLNQVLGKVNYAIPYFGYLIIFVKTIPGLITLIIIPSTIIVYQEVIQIQKNFKKILSR